MKKLLFLLVLLALPAHHLFAEGEPVQTGSKRGSLYQYSGGSGTGGYQYVRSESPETVPSIGAMGEEGESEKDEEALVLPAKVTKEGAYPVVLPMEDES